MKDQMVRPNVVTTAPYHQTARKEIYHRWAMKLVDKGLAYADPRPAEEIKALQDQAKAEHRLLPLSRPSARKSANLGRHHAAKVQSNCSPKDYHWHDEVMGDFKRRARCGR